MRVAALPPGQVYVALSRCRSKEGIILKSRITPQSIRTDAKVIEFSERLNSLNELENILKQEKTVFIEAQIKKHLSWDALLDQLKYQVENAKTKKHALKDESVEIMKTLVMEIQKLKQVTDKFTEVQLNQLLEEYRSGLLTDKLKQRLEAASAYTRKELKEKIYYPLSNHIDKITEEKKTRKYVKELNSLKEMINHKGESLALVGKLI